MRQNHLPKPPKTPQKHAKRAQKRCFWPVFGLFSSILRHFLTFCGEIQPSAGILQQFLAFRGFAPGRGPLFEESCILGHDFQSTKGGDPLFNVLSADLPTAHHLHSTKHNKPPKISLKWLILRHFRLLFVVLLHFVGHNSLQPAFGRVAATTFFCFLSGFAGWGSGGGSANTNMSGRSPLMLVFCRRRRRGVGPKGRRGGGAPPNVQFGPFRPELNVLPGPVRAR